MSLTVILKQVRDYILAVTDNYPLSHIDEVTKKLAGKTPSSEINVMSLTKKVFSRLANGKKDKRKALKISSGDMFNDILNDNKSDPDGSL